MSESSGSGAALDARARIDELSASPIVAELDAERMRLHHALYEEARCDTTSAVYAAHVAQLQRIYNEALAALDNTQRALDKAREHVEGKELAVGDAQAAYVAARDALEAVEPDNGSAE